MAQRLDGQAIPTRKRKLRLLGNTAARGSLEHFALFAAFIGIYWAYAGLGRDVFFNKLNDPTAYDPIGAVINYLRLLSCVIGIVVVTTHTTINWAISRIPMQFAPFMIFALASASWADAPMTTFQNAVVVCAIWVSVSMVMHRLGAADTVRAALHLIAVVCIASFLLAVLVPSIGRHTGLEAVQYVHAGRWRGIFGHKNGLGPWAAYGTVFLFTHSWMAGGPRLYWWFARISAIACLIFAESSTAVVMVLAMISAWAILQLLRRNSAGFVATLVGGIAVSAAILYYFAGEALFEFLGRDSTLSGRTLVWNLALQQFWERPLTGHGYLSLGGETFLVLLEQAIQQAILGAESGYLTLLLDLGLIGFLLFFVPYFGAMRNGLEWLPFVGREDRGAIEFMLITLFCVLVHAITETGALLAVGFDGVVSFGALFFLATLPRSPESIMRREFRKTRNWRRDKAPAVTPAPQTGGPRKLGGLFDHPPKAG
jgi:exopolysaccharide production protein ExoQ